MWIVWNAAKTEGFVTNDEQLAYEVRKSASSNCVTMDGEPAPVAVAFCERWCEDTCTTELLTDLRREVELLRAQLAARDAALTAVLELANDNLSLCDSNGERILRQRFIERLALHGVHK